jgi:hypothetical protein
MGLLEKLDAILIHRADIMKEALYLLILVLGTTIVLVIIRAIKKFISYRARVFLGDIEVKKENIKGEIDYLSLSRLIRRNNERRKQNQK